MKKKSLFISKDFNVLPSKIKESLTSVLPIFLLVLLLTFTFIPISNDILVTFIFGSVLLVVGMGVFSLGADIAMTPIGEYVGVTILKSKKMWVIIPLYFIVGVLITIAEPDLQLLALELEQAIGFWLLIIVVGVGVGVFLVIAFLKMLLRLKMSILLLICYGAVFVLAFFVPENFRPIAFDAGGVTTGPISVPFIIAIGTGVASMRSDKEAQSEGFGLTALCSIGPIITVMILGLIFPVNDIEIKQEVFVKVDTSKEVIINFGPAFPQYLKEVAIALLPITAFFFISYGFGTKMNKFAILRIVLGILYTYIGLVLFLVGANVGFTPVGNMLGEQIAENYKWLIIPVGMIFGFFVVAAEPAVHVLTKQVYEITGGTIPQKVLRYSLMIGVAVSIGLSMLRIILHLPIIYFVLVGYAIAVVLSFIVPEMWTSVAFDAGGVASGAMTASFLMPFALGVCSALGGDIASEGFGLIAFVAMTPPISIQILGLIVKIKQLKLTKIERKNHKKKEEIMD